MKFVDLEIGHYYTHGDDASYKVVDKGEDWVCVLSYSSHHNVASPIIFSEDDFNFDKLYEDTDEYGAKWCFDNLSYAGHDALS